MTKLEGFNYQDVTIAGDACYLVTPDHIGVKWTEENKRLRSAIIRKSDGKFISQGFRKFVNFGEQPDFEKWNPTWKVEALTKIDGSLLIISFYKGEWIIRTRGTVDARIHATGNEIDFLMEKYPHFFTRGQDIIKEDCSLLFEWTTPNNRIVLKETEEPTLWLLNAVAHNTGEYFKQSTLDYLALTFNFPRPKFHTFLSMEECLNTVKHWRGCEGVVVMSPDGETFKKIKADEYLKMHRLKSELTIGNMVELFCINRNIGEVRSRLEQIFDFETIQECEKDFDEIDRVYQEFLTESEDVEKLVASLDPESNRGVKARTIIANYNDWRAAYAFNILDGKGKTELYKKLNDILNKKIKP